MPKKLIAVSKSGAVSRSMVLDTEGTLSAAREILQQADIMKAADLFLSQGSEVERSQESIAVLNDILAVGESRISIGGGNAANPLDPKDGVQRYNELSASERQALFEQINLFNGLTLNHDGFNKTFQRAYSWVDGKNPAAVQPLVASAIDYSYSFSSLTQTMAESSVDKASVSLSTPLAEATAEFAQAKSKSTSTETVTEYINGKFRVNKVAIQVKPESLQADAAFEKAVAAAIKSDPDEFQQYYALLNVLNEFGYYLPLQFSLGGALTSSDSTQISKFEQAESEKTEFSGSFKAKFDGIGGSGAYSQARGSEQKVTKSDKFQITAFKQIGGRDGTSNSYPDWAKSLDKAIYWEVVSYDRLYPTIALIRAAELQNTCIRLMNTYASYPHAVEAQPYLDMTKYASAVQALYPSPW
jgi:hypothetical protein